MLSRFRRKEQSRSIKAGSSKETPSRSEGRSGSNKNDNTNETQTAGPSRYDSFPTLKSALSGNLADIGPSARKNSKEEAAFKKLTLELEADPLGLTIIHEPATLAKINIIFVHGLGGSSKKSWSWNRDLKLFWPKEWLPAEPSFESARILSFGYNAKFQTTGKNIWNIGDFATYLLAQMKFGSDAASNPLNIEEVKVRLYLIDTADKGKLPIIFIAHSMGGLVVKKAYILAQYDPVYQNVVNSVCAIIFLATPHGGSDLAGTLNQVLSSSPFGQTSKQYVAELTRNSPTIQDINKQFKNLAHKLDIASFFETMSTPIKVGRTMIVKRDSAVIGLSNEIDLPLNADHHTVCKFSSKQDPNYRSVRDVLRSFVLKFQTPVAGLQFPVVEDSQELSDLLGISQVYDDDLEFYHERWAPGSCEWILDNEKFKAWADDQSQLPSVLWISGPPGSGKSVLASFVTKHLQEILPRSTMFHFFRFFDQEKKTMSYFLRSMAYQIAMFMPDYRERLLKLAQDSHSLAKASVQLLWQKLFTSGLFKLHLQRPVFCILDALDESDIPERFLRLLSSQSKTETPLRFLFTSRLQILKKEFDRLTEKAFFPVQQLFFTNSDHDIRQYLANELSYTRWSAAVKDLTVRRILEKANGNFLWVTLVVRKLEKCHTADDVHNLLDQVPSELEELYLRLTSSIANGDADLTLTITILTWIVCAERQLDIEELASALQPEYSPFYNLQQTVAQLCGDFVVVDSKGYLSLVHHTAREFLTKRIDTPLYIAADVGHTKLLQTCLGLLMHPETHIRVDRHQSERFLQYSAVSWSYHLEHCHAAPNLVLLKTLGQFFTKPCVLSWIHLLAKMGQLRVLVATSKALTMFLRERAEFDAERSPSTHPLFEKDILERSATDLVNLVGKFGIRIVSHPRSIYSLVPAFCPAESLIRQQFGVRESSTALAVSGITLPRWDDCLAKFSIGRDLQAVRILSLDRYFAVVGSEGTIVLCDSTTCEELSRFTHGESILAICFSERGDLLVTCGYSRTNIWSVFRTHLVDSFASPKGAKAVGIAFCLNDSRLWICADNRYMYSATLLARATENEASEGRWTCSASPVSEQTFDGRYYNSPRCVAFNADGTQVALAYRAFPLSVWSVDPAHEIGKCRRSDKNSKSRQDLWHDVLRICWNNITGHVLGIHGDGTVFKWHPLESENKELKVLASEIACSPDGNLFVTSTTKGALKIWNFHNFEPIYQVSSNTSVTALCISPNGRRVYDLRDSYCNVWEPNALIRLAEAEEKTSDVSSAYPDTSKSSRSDALVEMREAISCLVASPRSRAYCAGNDDGVLTFYPSPASLPVEHASNFPTAIHQLAWSADDQTIASVDLYGIVTVWRVSAHLADGPSLQKIFSITATDQSVKQLFISPDSRYLLVIFPELTKVFSIREERLLAEKRLDGKPSKWVESSVDSHIVLRCGYDFIEIFKISDLALTGTLRIERPILSPEEADVQQSTDAQDLISRRRASATQAKVRTKPDLTIDRVLVNQDRTRMLLETSHFSTNRRQRKYALIDTSSLEISSSRSVDLVVECMELPVQVKNRIQMAFGFVKAPTSMTSTLHEHPITPLPRGSYVLAFLDRDFWVCTCSSSNAGAPIKRHFFLPRDWMNFECLELAIVMSDGTFLCPRNGEIAVVLNGLRENWSD